VAASTSEHIDAGAGHHRQLAGSPVGRAKEEGDEERTTA